MNIKHFWKLSYNHQILLGITRLSYPYFQENGMSKKCLDATLDWQSGCLSKYRELSDFFNKKIAEALPKGNMLLSF